MAQTEAIRFVLGARDRTKGVFAAVNRSLRSMKRMAGEATIAAAGISAALGGTALAIRSLVNESAQIESTTVRMKTFLRSAEQANIAIEKIARLGAKTPFEFGELSDLAAGMAATGFPMKDMEKNIRMIGNAAATAQRPLDNVGFWFKRIRGQIMNGEAFGGSITEMSEMGIIAEGLKTKMEGMVKAGKSGDEVWSTFAKSFDRFSGQMDAQSATYLGLVSTMEDARKALMRSIADGPLMEAAKEFVKTLTSEMEKMSKSGTAKKLGETLAELVKTATKFSTNLSGAFDLLSRVIASNHALVYGFLGGLDKARAALSSLISMGVKVMQNPILARILDPSGQMHKFALKLDPKIFEDMAASFNKDADKNFNEMHRILATWAKKTAVVAKKEGGELKDKVLAAFDLSSSLTAAMEKIRASSFDASIFELTGITAKAGEAKIKRLSDLVQGLAQEFRKPADELQRLRQVYNGLASIVDSDATGMIRGLMSELSKKINNLTIQSKVFWAAFVENGVQGIRTIADDLSTYISSGFEGSFSDILKSWQQMLTKMLLDAAFQKLLSYLGGTMEKSRYGWIQAMGSGLNAGLSGARAGGGPVSKGNRYLVGEFGPEIFTPNSSGMITPSGKTGGGNLTVNISSPMDFRGSSLSEAQVQAYVDGSNAKLERKIAYMIQTGQLKRAGA